MVRRAPLEKSAALDGKRIYILPTGQGMLFSLLLFLMLTGSINYALSLGFMLTFLLAGLYFVSIYHAFSNLAGLRLEPGKVSPVFAGEDAVFGIIAKGGNRKRFGIGIEKSGCESFYEIEAGKPVAAEFRVKALKRGWLHPGRFAVFTLHPAGFFRAWSYVELSMPCLVYPSPSFQNRGAGKAPEGDEDFSGLRAYRPGDSLKHAAWKSYSAGGELLVKEFREMKDEEELWLDWNALEGGIETRLSRLAGMAIEAHSQGLRFGLRLPNKTIRPASGHAQKLRVLEALALFES